MTVMGPVALGSMCRSITRRSENPKAWRGLNELHFPQGEKLSPDNPRHVHPHGQTDGEKDLPESFAKCHGDGKDH